MAVTLITGTSTGIGFESALHFARNGHKVFATMRNLKKAGPLKEITEQENLPLTILELDVTSQQSTDEAIKEIIAQEGFIDILINNAGIGGAAPLELVGEEEHRMMFETNYWGAIRMIKAVLPLMREKKEGCIINVSSMAGRVATFNQIPYSASKFALEAASEALALEVRAFGIRVILIEPGITQTAIFENSAEHTLFDKSSPYQHIMNRSMAIYGWGLKNPEKASNVANLMLEVSGMENPELRYPIGDDSRKFIQGRSEISDAEWADLGGEMTDQEYKAKMKKYFDFDL